MKIGRGFLPTVLVLASAISGWAFEITDVSPVTGPPGTVVQITGSAFNPAASYSATINGRAATVRNVSETGLELVVAAGTASGSITISEAGSSRTALEPFVVTRVLQGRVAVPAGVGIQGYGVIAYQSAPAVAPISATEATFTIEAPIDQPVVVWALRNRNDPPFLALLTSDETEAVVDANSTAIALALLNPAIAATDDAKARRFKTIIRDRNLAPPMRDFLEANARPGLNYMIDARFEDAMVTMITAAIATEAPPPPPIARDVTPQFPSGTFIHPLNREFLLSELTTQLTLVAPTAERPDSYVLKVDVGSRFSSLDWVIEVYKLRRFATDFPDGLASVAGLTYTSTPAFVDTIPVAEGILPAKLDSARLDYFKTLAKWIVSKASDAIGDPNALKGNHLPIPDRPEIYVVHASSGNVFWRYGGQEYIVDSHDPNSAWARALAANIFLAGIDVATIFIDFKKLTGFNDAGFINAQLKDVTKAVTSRLADGSLTGDEVISLVGVCASAIISNALWKIGENLWDQGIFAALGNVGGVMLSSSVNIFKKIASGAQSVERAGGLFAPGRLAVERAVMVIGDPFAPRILEISPSRARKNDLVTIRGQNYPFGPAIVEFCVFADGAGPDADPVRALPATVVSKSANVIVISVPTNFAEVFAETDRVFLRVLDGVKRGDSRILGAAGQFRYIPPPRLLGVRPAQQIAGGDLTLDGLDFSPNSSDQVILIDGSIEIAPTRVLSNTMYCLIPSNLALGQHTIAVRLGTDVSDPRTFDVVEAPDNAENMPPGAFIQVNIASMLNTPSDHGISLLEAILLSRGQLGRDLEQHEPCELLPRDHPSACPRVPREVDYVTGGAPGVLGADYISPVDWLDGQTIALNVPITLGTGDELYAPDVILNGAGVPAGQAAIELVDVFGAQVNAVIQSAAGDAVRISGGGQHSINVDVTGAGGSGVKLEGATGHNGVRATLRNTAAHGIHVTAGASWNTFHATITDSGGSGVFLEGAAQHNHFSTITATRSGLHGLHLSGAGVRENRVHGSAGETPARGFDVYENSGGYGIVIDGGASDNLVTALRVSGNARGGIALLGEGTTRNYIGNVFSRGFNNTPHIRVYDNQGPGVYLGPGVLRNEINHVTVAGNAGDGVLLEGPNCFANTIGTIWTGFDFFATGGAVEKPNTGNGLRIRNGATENIIGSRRYPQTYSHRSIFANNGLSGILVEGAGTERNRISRADFGVTAPASFYSGNRHIYKNNGLDGVTIQGGAKWTTVGDENFYFDCHIFGSPRAGVFISGNGTSQNTVYNCHIGFAHNHVELAPADGNRFGIVIENGAKGNVIGVRGERRSFNQYPFTLEFGNTISKSLEAGIVLDNCGGAGPDGNIVQNNTIGIFNFTPPSYGNPTGILIKNNALGNLVGGSLPATGNSIRANESAGIHIDNVAIPNPALRNRITGNAISRQGVTVANPTPINIINGPPHGIGILISGASSGNVVGELAINDINQNVAGIFLFGAGVTDTTIRANTIGNFTGGSHAAGGVIVNGAARTLIGETGPGLGNTIWGNGAAGNDPCGGIVLINSDGHVVQNNIVRRNIGSGITLVNSDDNLVGGTDITAANTINENTGPGIALRQSANNRAQNNFIGTDRAGARLGNTLDGIFIDGGGAQMIGGSLAATPGIDPINLANTIAYNNGAGVFVTGASGVSILYNSIHDNGAEGIHLGINANHNIAPPTLLSFGSAITGRVEDRAETPPGSRIQVFSDTAGEGRAFLGETTVRDDGTWILLPAPLTPFRNLTATVTRPDDASTSPFGAGFELIAGFRLRRDGPAVPETRSLPTSATRAVVHQLIAETGDLPVSLEALRIASAGTLPDDLSIEAAFVVFDANENGEFDEADWELSPRVRFPQDNGELTLSTAPFTIPEDSARKLLVIYEFSQPVAGANFELAVPEATAITAETVLPVNNPVLTIGTFPIRSDLIEFIGSGANFATWRSRHFTAEELNDPSISGADADPDRDQLGNALEYALGFDPKTAEANVKPRIYRDQAGRLIYEYQRRRLAPDLVFNLRFSDDLMQWFTDNRFVESTQLTTLTEETEQVRLILNETFPNANVALSVQLAQ